MAKKIISLEIPDELKEQLRIEAFKQNLSISALIRNILQDKFSQEVNDHER